MLDLLEERFGYRFSSAQLPRLAITHRSFSGSNNERLEFLGDSILNFVIGDALYRKFPKAKEGQLSRVRAALVCGDTLAEIAREIDLGPLLLLGSGEAKSGGHDRPSILADVVEALIAAVYLESDFESASQCVLALYESRLASVSADAQRHKDAKSRLQEWLQARRHDLPQYDVLATSGAQHAQTFTVSCKVKALKMSVIAEGETRRGAEQTAAEKMLEKLESTS